MSDANTKTYLTPWAPRQVSSTTWAVSRTFHYSNPAQTYQENAPHKTAGFRYFHTEKGAQVAARKLNKTAA